MFKKKMKDFVTRINLDGDGNFEIIHDSQASLILGGTAQDPCPNLTTCGTFNGNCSNLTSCGNYNVPKPCSGLSST